jgi:hypothetical protein
MAPGWGIAPIFAGQQHPSIPGLSHVRTAEQGRQDALLAAQLADQAGFAGEAGLAGVPTIYLDIEYGCTLPREDLTYVNAWCATIRSEQTSYLPGVRSVKETVTRLLHDNPDLVSLKPSRDLDVSVAPDPSHPERKFDPDAGIWLD